MYTPGSQTSYQDYSDTTPYYRSRNHSPLLDSNCSSPTGNDKGNNQPWKRWEDPHKDFRQTFEKKLEHNSLFREVNKANPAYKGLDSAVKDLNTTDSFQYRVESLLEEDDHIVTSKLQAYKKSLNNRVKGDNGNFNIASYCPVDFDLGAFYVEKPRFRRKSDVSSWSGGISKFEAKTVLLTCQMAQKKTVKIAGDAEGNEQDPAKNDKKRIMTTFESRTKVETPKELRSFTTVKARASYGGKLKGLRSEKRINSFAPTSSKNMDASTEKVAGTRGSDRKSTLNFKMRSSNLLRGTVVGPGREDAAGNNINNISPINTKETDSSKVDTETSGMSTQKVLKNRRKTFVPTSTPLTEATKIQAPLTPYTSKTPTMKAASTYRVLTEASAPTEQKRSSFFRISEPHKKVEPKGGNNTPRVKMLNTIKDLRNETHNDFSSVKSDSHSVIPQQPEKNKHEPKAVPSLLQKEKQQMRTYANGFVVERNENKDKKVLSAKMSKTPKLVSARVATESMGEATPLRSHRALRMNTYVEVSPSRFSPDISKEKSDEVLPFNDYSIGKKGGVKRPFSYQKMSPKEIKGEKGYSKSTVFKNMEIIKTYNSVKPLVWKNN